jgi:hypothetical protein
MGTILCELSFRDKKSCWVQSGLSSGDSFQTTKYRPECSSSVVS